MAVVPILQIAMLFLIPWALMSNNLYFTDTIELLTFLGVIFFFVIAVYSIILDRDFRDLMYLPYGMLILPISYFYNMVAIYSWWKEFQGAEERWEKIERRKVFAANRKTLKHAVIGILLIIASSAGTYYYLTAVPEPVEKNASFDLGLSTHFDAWGDWRKTVSSILKRPDIGMADIVGVSAGRPEWVYFKWEGHKGDWSNHQKGAREDLLERAVSSFHKAGFKVAALIDVYGPKYVKEHPGTEAIGFDGNIHDEQVGFSEFVEGEYGKKVLDMIEYLSKNSEVDIVNLTEMPYYSYSYGPRDLKSYMTFSGKSGWPRTRDGLIDRDDRSVWEWKSTLMEGFIKKAAEIAHLHKKELYVDVPVNWEDISQNGRESGLDYRRVLKYADNIVIWNYFFLEKLPPSASEALAKYLSYAFPGNSFYISLGLWGKDGAVMDPKPWPRG